VKAMIRTSTIRFAERSSGPRLLGHAVRIRPVRPTTPWTVNALCRPSDPHDGQVAAPGMELNVKFQPCAGLTPNKCPRPRTRRTAWPAIPRFEPWPAVGRESTEVTFVGRAATQSTVWTLSVVPIDGQADFAPKGVGSQGHYRQGSEQNLGTQDQSFDDCDAPMLADGQAAFLCSTAESGASAGPEVRMKRRYPPDDIQEKSSQETSDRSHRFH